MAESESEYDALLDEAAAALEKAESVLFITGAGVSADSGLPTYRGIGGLYEDADTEDGLAIEDMLSGPMFRKRPELTWKYIRQIEEACRGAGYNDAHRIMAAFEGDRRAWVLTQNVDGLHRKAGSQQVIEIHGNVHDLDCTRCAWTESVADYASLPPLPKCPECGAVVRPRVVLFGEMLPGPQVANLERELGRGFEAVVSVGTSSLFPYIAGPVVHTAAMGGITMEINPGSTPVSGLVGTRIQLGAAEAMRGIATRLSLHWDR